MLSHASSICQIDILCQYCIMLNVAIDLPLLRHSVFYFVYFSSGYIYQQQFYKKLLCKLKPNLPVSTGPNLRLKLQLMNLESA